MKYHRFVQLHKHEQISLQYSEKTIFILQSVFHAMMVPLIAGNQDSVMLVTGEFPTAFYSYNQKYG